MFYTINKKGTWYQFSSLPQGYFKIDWLNCGTDRKAINTARRILGDKKAIINIARGI